MNAYFFISLRKIYVDMSKLYTLWGIIRRLKYIVVILFIVLINGVLDDNSWYENYKRRKRIEEIKVEIAQLKERFAEDTRRYNALDKPSEIERVAREKFLMKRPDEDVFVVVDESKKSFKERFDSLGVDF